MNYYYKNTFVVLSLCVIGLFVFVELRFPNVVLNKQYRPAPQPRRIEKPNDNRTVRCYKKVLIWEAHTGSKRPIDVYTCPNSPCTVETSYTSNDVNMIPNKDAVVIEYWSNRKLALSQFKKKSVGQKWIIAVRESALIHRIIPSPPFQSAYDWIMSFRHGSNISIDWGYYDKGNPDWTDGTVKNMAKGKSKLISWISSNCHNTAWPRTGFVLKLNKYVPVDRFGQCGNKPLPCKRFSIECGKYLKQYKFYLALENTQCRDYITEKFWRNALRFDVVPVVVGAPKEDYERVAPPNSFIYAEDFKSVADLAEYLKLLDSNDTLYNEYFKWKKDGSIIDGTYLDYDAEVTMCRVADKLHQVELNPALESPPISLRLNGPWWKGSCKKANKQFKLV